MSAERLCPDCMTTDAAFPLIEGCQSCKATLAQDEYDFWNTPLYYVDSVFDNGTATREPVMPREVMRRIFQPWKALFNLISLT
jgi:hypothetical protein